MLRELGQEPEERTTGTFADDFGMRPQTEKEDELLPLSQTPHPLRIAGAESNFLSVNPMRKVFYRISLLLSLLLTGAMQACTHTNPPAGPPVAQQHLFNARDFGAVGDDRTDNTEAFSACLKAIIEAGGGRMYLPDGVYRGRIVIPPVSKPFPSWITVEIVGESEPTPVWGTVGNFPLQNHGTIVKCLATEGAAVISAASATNGALYGNFSAVYVVIRNLDVRTYNNPAIGGIDLANAMQCRLENVFINTDIYNVQASKPTHGTKGLLTPKNGNAALTILRNVTVTGYDTGILVFEHTDGDNINLGSNVNGLMFASAQHASRFSRVCAQRCTHAIRVTGPSGFSIQQLDIEQAGPGQTDTNNVWQTTVSHVDDPKNFGVGDINYWVVIGKVGARDVFTMTGGAQIRARRIGSPPGVETRQPTAPVSREQK